MSTPTVIPRSEHSISRSGISENALKVLYRLKGAGFTACLVGGGVRDMLLGREPKDFDITTDALPEQVKKLFSNCRLIGRRFRLAHVYFGRDIVEVATFRGEHSGDEEGGVIVGGRLVRDNVYGTIEEDAFRRDFTVNALYYNIDGFTVIDYVGGMADLKSGLLRLIGQPDVRYQEDPVRMLRAVRFAAKLGFRIAGESEQLIWKYGHLLQEVAAARLFDEVIKLFMCGFAAQTFEYLRHYRLFAYLYPETDRCIDSNDEFALALINQAMKNTDQRVAEGKPVTPAFLHVVLLWPPMRQIMAEYQASGLAHTQAMHLATRKTVSQHLNQMAMPRRFSSQMKEIWLLQPRLLRITGRRCLRLLGHPRFRAAYDFLLLRNEAGEDLGEYCDWWTRLQEASDNEKIAMCRPRKPRRKRKRIKKSN